MSGPKGFSYTVVSQAELDRRACQASSMRCDELSARVADLVGRLQTFGGEEVVDRVDDRPGETDVAGWGRREQELARTRERLEAALVSGRNERVADLLRSRLGRVEVAIDLDLSSLRPATSTPFSAVENADPRRAPDTTSTTVARQGSVDALCGLLAEVEDAVARDALADRAAGILATGGKRGLGLLRALQSDAQAAVRSQNRQAELTSRYDAAIDATAELPSDLAADVRRHAVVAGRPGAADVEALERHLREARSEHARRQDDEFVRQQAVEVLGSLGYDVSNDGDGLLASGAAAGDRHALQVRFLPDRARFITNVVAVAETSAAANTAAEKSTCSDITTLGYELRRHGVEAQRDHHRPPGAVPVAQVAAPDAAQRRRKRTQARERKA